MITTLYCERLESGAWGEPLNVSSNLVFFAAACAAWSLARRLNALTPGTRVLIGLSFAIGIGSALYHLFASSWARLLDEIPILLFQLCFLCLYASNVMRLRWQTMFAALFLYCCAVFFSRQYPAIINGSLPYTPALLLMLGLGLYHLITQKPERYLLLAALAMFAVSLSFRSLDRVLCPQIPTGTHFLWHILNGFVLYLCMRALAVNHRKSPV